jgi:acetyltransferase-like isoleucine patch superfamily enzyme
VRRDHRPYFVKRLDIALQQWYANYFLRPQFDHLGKGSLFLRPWYVELFGWPITLDDYANVIATPDKRIRMTVWSDMEEAGRIQIGKYALICPGVRISSAMGISIGDSCMLAQGVYVTDSDWHDIYDRGVSIGRKAAVKIGNNVWLGDSAIVCKGVTIGDNSIVGAGSVVVRDVPPNVVAAGNPADVLRQLDSNRYVGTRADWFSDPEKLACQFDEIDRDILKDNTIFGWMRSRLFPRRGD